MSEPTFTPGPWNVAGFDSRINEERYFGIDTPRGQMIVESFGECDFNRKANAALISAAPEMYAKLKELAAATSSADEGASVAYKIKDLEGQVELDAAFTFSCQAEMIIFELSLRSLA